MRPPQKNVYVSRSGGRQAVITTMMMMMMIIAISIESAASVQIVSVRSGSLFLNRVWFVASSLGEASDESGANRFRFSVGGFCSSCFVFWVNEGGLLFCTHRRAARTCAFARISHEEGRIQSTRLMDRRALAPYEGRHRCVGFGFGWDSGCGLEFSGRFLLSGSGRRALVRAVSPYG